MRERVEIVRSAMSIQDINRATAHGLYPECIDVASETGVLEVQAIPGQLALLRFWQANTGRERGEIHVRVELVGDDRTLVGQEGHVSDPHSRYYMDGAEMRAKRIRVTAYACSANGRIYADVKVTLRALYSFVEAP